MSKRRLQFRPVIVASPWLTLVMLVLLSFLLPNRAVVSAEAQVHKSRVAAAIEAAPHFINGTWVGQDSDERLPRQAQELLRPNAILSRSYSAPGRPTVHVLIVHCGDARDMIGHYPPICYPSAGWVENGASSGIEHALNLQGRTMPVREYLYSRPRDQFREDTIRVLNVFVLPDGRNSSRIHDINKQSERLALSVHGVAQVQLITLASVPLSESLSAAEELLGGLTGVLNALSVKKEESSDFQTTLP